jgi:tRNA modification GTPase
MKITTPLPASREGRPSYGDERPIAAFATPPGESALTLIRCSGKNTVELAAAVFSRPQKLRAAPANSIVHGWITAPEKIDEVLIAVYRAPKSYTGEEGLDISCHGGLAAGHAVMGALRAAGFRDALPGEFTLRAFLNGKLGLTQAESVMEIVAARGDMGRRRAVGRLSGALEAEIRAVKRQLVEVLAGTELFLDYSEDELETGGAEALGLLPERHRAEEALARLDKLAASWAMERLCRDGALTVIAGRPNAGKSSLFNLLLREERSIVTEIPGTTRDWIEGWLSLEGFPLRLMDTAGLRESGGPGADPVEQIGMERSRELIEQADIILYVVDGAAGLSGGDRAFLDAHAARNAPGEKAPPLIIVWNKADIAPPPAGTFPGGRPLSLSAQTGQGLPDLIAALSAALGGIAGGDWEPGAPDSSGTSLGESPGDSPGIGTARQKELIATAQAAVGDALSLSAQGEALDLIAPLLREAVNALGEITGEVSTAEILETMFSRFCVGK